MSSSTSALARLRRLAPRFAQRSTLVMLASLCLCTLLPACTVISVAGTAVSVTAGAVGLAADAAIGTAKIVGKGVGKAADALMDDKAPDNSGINVRYRDTAQPASPPTEMPAGTNTEPFSSP